MECDEITSIIGMQKLLEITAKPAVTGVAASKVMWIKNNELHDFEKNSENCCSLKIM